MTSIKTDSGIITFLTDSTEPQGNYNLVEVEFVAELLCWIVLKCTVVPNKVNSEIPLFPLYPSVV